jgi:hypothetical protein
MNTDVKIIGKGNIGDKARQLIEKTPRLREIGFHTPRRIVLAEDFFDGFFQTNQLGERLGKVKSVESLEKKVREGSLTEEEFEILCRVTSSFGNVPFVVRSSAEGDARGTGIYRTLFCESEAGEVSKAVREVLASYFSSDAITFRRDAKTGEGFGVMLEPLIGQSFEWCFAPVLSGFGYTSTARGEGYIGMVPGLGGGVDTPNGERISGTKLKRFNGNLQEYLYWTRKEMLREREKRKSALMRKDELFDDYELKAFFCHTNSGPAHIDRASLNLEKEIGEPFDRLNLNDLFAMMNKMEESFGVQYFEWAMTFEDGGPKHWITQVANVDKKLDTMDFGDLGKVFFMGHTVTGTGVRECNRMVCCFNPEQMDSLRQFNRANERYLLLYSSRLTTNFLAPISGKLGYGDYNNASVFLEIPDAGHSGDPVAHLDGRLEKAGKLFGVLDYRAEVSPQWEELDRRAKEEYGMKVYQGKVKVIASERQDKIVVSAMD